MVVAVVVLCLGLGSFGCVPPLGCVSLASAASYRKLATCGGGAISEPGGLAVDQLNGDVLQGQHSNGIRVLVPNERANPATGCSVGAQFGSGDSWGVAVDGSGEVYAAEPQAKSVFKLIGPGLPGEGLPGAPSQFGPGTEPTQELRGPESVAVDPTTGDIYVEDRGSGMVDVYEPGGGFKFQFSTGAIAEEEVGLALNSQNDLYVVVRGEVEEYEIEATSAKHIGNLDEGGEPRAVAVDRSTGDVYVDDDVSGVLVYDSAGSPIPQLSFQAGFVLSFGIAVDEITHTLYVSGYPTVFSAPEVYVYGYGSPPAPKTGSASEVTETGATLNGTIDREGEPLKLCQFEWGTGSAYEHIAPCEQGLAQINGEEPATVSVKITGLSPNTHYHFRLDAEDASGATQGSSAPLRTPGPPLVESQSFAETEETNVTLGAMISTEGLEGEWLEGEYEFEYGLRSVSEHRTVARPFVAPSGPATVKEAIGGLRPGAEYHARVVVIDRYGVTPGPEEAFTTYPTSSALLPDGRRYEIVTPLANVNVDIYYPNAPGGYLLDSKDGFTTSLPFRAATDGEAVTYAGDPPPVSGSASQSRGGGNQYLAVRLSGGGWGQQAIQPPGEERLHPLHYECFGSDLTEGFLSSPRALVGGAPSGNVLYARNDESGAYSALAAGGVYKGATADASHVLVAVAENLYDFTEGTLKQVNLSPDGGNISGARFGGTDLLNAISADGSRIFWTGGEGTLYVREGDARTQKIAEDARFWAAGADGGKVFFTDEQEGLTSNSTAANNEPNLYEYNLEAPASERLTDLTPDEHADVKGVIGASEDGAYVYFVATGKLVPGASSEPCSRVEATSIDTGCGLYVYHQGGSPELIANLSYFDLYRLPGSEANAGNFGDAMEGLEHRTAEVGASGNIVFMAKESLTGYRAEGEVDSGEAADQQNNPIGSMYEVYLYDPQASRLYCVSCSPAGELPSITNLKEAGAQAAYVPVSNNETYQPRFVSANGSEVFFDSVEPLVPQDTNSAQDVYEWERPGTNGCEQRRGCVYLLSGGTSSTFSWLLDASASGEDVFIITRAQLIKEDQSYNYNVYDVSNDGPAQAAPTTCAGGACQGAPPAPPIFATPASVTFEGEGNFLLQSSAITESHKSKPCKKGYVGKRGKCVKTKKKRRSGGGKAKRSKAAKRGRRQ